MNITNLLMSLLCFLPKYIVPSTIKNVNEKQPFSDYSALYPEFPSVIWMPVLQELLLLYLCYKDESVEGCQNRNRTHNPFSGGFKEFEVKMSTFLLGSMLHGPMMPMCTEAVLS